MPGWAGRGWVHANERCSRGGGLGLLTLSTLSPCLFLSLSHSPNPPPLTLCPSSLFPPGGLGTGRVCLCPVVVEEQRKRARPARINHIQTYAALTPCTFISLIAPSTKYLECWKYLYVLYLWLGRLLSFYFKQYGSVGFTIRSSCFRVAEISFYITDFTFYLCSLQISSLTVSKIAFPRFDNMCPRGTKVIENGGEVTSLKFPFKDS
jgi:hypothetical protein